MGDIRAETARNQQLARGSVISPNPGGTCILARLLL